ncbi:MAG TPA: hypothetical protein VEJ86_13065, partial [Candidatus Binataceae bacterium]|nr:hypothetical protein [Candidatus Binataceae bacterium]
MNNSLILPIAIVVLVVALLIFVRIIRVIVGLLFRIAIGVVATIIAVSAIAILLNNETIYESPGIEARAIHFLTWRTAATSEKGLGSATCTWPDESPS